MSISKKASNLLTNKYILYFVLFLAVTTVFGYMSMNNTNAVILFVLINLVCCLFTKNMIIILGLSVFITNLLVVMKGTNTTSYKEGLENQEPEAQAQPQPQPRPAPRPAPKPTLEPTPAFIPKNPKNNSEPEPENTISNTENTEKKKINEEDLENGFCLATSFTATPDKKTEKK